MKTQQTITEIVDAHDWLTNGQGWDQSSAVRAAKMYGVTMNSGDSELIAAARLLEGEGNVVGDEYGNAVTLTNSVMAMRKLRDYLACRFVEAMEGEYAGVTHPEPGEEAVEPEEWDALDWLCAGRWGTRIYLQVAEDLEITAETTTERLIDIEVALEKEAEECDVLLQDTGEALKFLRQTVVENMTKPEEDDQP